VIGLDGATFDLIDPLVRAGRLPTIADLLAKGVRGRLMSTIPAATVPAWPSFMTGKSPARHGVFDFFKRDAHGKQRLVSSRDIRGPTLWRYLSDHGRRCIVLNVPCTYPPESINGVLVSGMLTPVNGEYVSPREKATQLDSWTGGYRVNPRSKYVRSPFDRDELLRELQEVSVIQKRAFLKLLETEDWDFAMLMFRATDVVQHKLWHRPEDVAEVYELMDGALAEIAVSAGDASIWLVSDHGFGPQEKLLHINQWLRDQGWLAIRPKTSSTLGQPELGVTIGQESLDLAASARLWLARAGLGRDRARTLLPRAFQPTIKRILPRALRRWMPGSTYEVDWHRTQVVNDNAFTQETQALLINLCGREPEGIVVPDEYESLRRGVIQALKELRDPETGHRVVTEVYRGDELFAGPYADHAPDLILQLRDGYKMIGDLVAREYVSRLPQTAGCHRRDGIFVAAGTDLASGLDLGELAICDVMPSLLHFVGLAVPRDCDGRVRLDLFAPKSGPANRQVVYQNVTSAVRSVEAEPEENDEEVVSRLRALGYVD
jgi:predicted AlkP superfamily phosphohydrolase/phosphomutase